jgi:hypothetical protein
VADTSVVSVAIPYDIGTSPPNSVSLQFHDGLVIATRADRLRCSAQVDVSGDTREICQEIIDGLAPEARLDPISGDLHIDLRRPPNVSMGDLHVCYTLEIPDHVPLRVQTARGQVNLRGLGGEVTVITADGAIRARMVGGEADLRSRSGLVSLSGRYRSAYLESGTGRIEAALPLCDPPAQIEVRTVTGETVFEVPENLGVDLYYDGALADLRTDLPIDWRPAAGAREGTIGLLPADGTAEVRVLTAGAKVRFEKRPAAESAPAQPASPGPAAAR